MASGSFESPSQKVRLVLRLRRVRRPAGPCRGRQGWDSRPGARTGFQNPGSRPIAFLSASWQMSMRTLRDLRASFTVCS